MKTMKNLKKIASLLLALMVVLTMMPFAVAETEKGSITIDNVVITDGKPVATYSIYQMLILESYKAGTTNSDGTVTPGIYSYKAASEAWEDFIENGAGKDYMTIKSNGYVEWKEGVSKDKVTAGVLAQKALEYAKEKSIAPIKSSANIATDTDISVDGDELKFSNLDLGYYLIDSSIGALCGLDTTNPDAKIEAKNVAPTINKEVKVGAAYRDENDASIGDTVEFRTTIDVHKGSENFVLHDTMSAGLTFNGVGNVRVSHIKVGGTEHDATVNTDYSVKVKGETGVCADCTFEVHFTDTFMNKLDSGDEVYVYYTATLNEKAVVETANGGDNFESTNKTHLSYGDNHNTTEDQTTTRTYKFDIVKVDGEGDLLNGAEFKLYKKVETTDSEGNPVIEYWAYPLKEIVKGELYCYTGVAPTAATDDDGATITTAGGTSGHVTIEGFGTGTYYLKEEKAPQGYNILSEPVKIELAGDNTAVFDTTGAYQSGGFEVVNYAGGILPGTGGIGTTLFYTVGGMLVAAAVVLLVTRKRMSER